MSEIKALDELRRIAEQMDAIAAAQSEHGFSPGAIKIMNAVEHLEAEIAERYIELPADEEGYVLRIGDEMKLRNDGEGFFLNGLVWNGRRWYATGTMASPDWHPVHLCRHVRPRRVEDVLRECGKSYYAHMTDNYMNYDGTDDQLIAKYADEIRGLIEKGEDR